MRTSETTFFSVPGSKNLGTLKYLNYLSLVSIIIKPQLFSYPVSKPSSRSRSLCPLFGCMPQGVGVLFMNKSGIDENLVFSRAGWE